MAAPARHIESFPIRAFECDLHGRLLPRTFCLLLQEANGVEAARARTVWREAAADHR